MTIEQMRGEISLAYSGPAWAARVGRMSDSQVCAVYHRLSTTGKLEEAAKERRQKASPSLYSPKQQQISFFDKEYGL